MNENYSNKSHNSNREIDTPLKDNVAISEENQTTTMSSDKVDDFEKKLDKQVKMLDKFDKHLYKLHALHLLVGCGIAYLTLVIFEMIVTNAFSWHIGELMNGFIELLKFIISTLIGYVFSENQKDKNG